MAFKEMERVGGLRKGAQGEVSLRHHHKAFTITISPDVAAKAGLKIGDGVKILEGYGDDAGFFALTPDNDAPRKLLRTSRAKQYQVSFPARSARLNGSIKSGTMRLKWEIPDGSFVLIIDLREYTQH